MTDEFQNQGVTTIAPDVLVTIARLTTLGVPGVSRLAPIHGGFSFLKREETDGVQIVVENNAVYADIFVVLEKDVNIREVGHTIQNQVSRAIMDMVGMDVGKINIHVEDIDYSTATIDQS